ncbi:FAD-dependent oxidoreductase [Streptacidiphilus monticola]
MRYGPGQFAGELNHLTGQRRALAVWVATAGTVYRLSADGFRRLMAQEVELSDVFLRAFLARRRLLRYGGGQPLHLVGDPASATGMALRTYLARQGLPFQWHTAPAEDPHTATLTADDLPAAVLGRTVLRQVTPALLGDHLNLTYGEPDEELVDLAVVGAGPGFGGGRLRRLGRTADRAARRRGHRGQAATSARIENYLGFPFGVSGADLAARAAVQALKFGVRIASPCRVSGLDSGAGEHVLSLADGTRIRSRCVIVATGAEYRALPLAGWRELTGRGIYYAATDLEAQAVQGRPVVVVGGANSAGQAALHLARYASSVDLVVRGGELGARMSAYLVDRVEADPRITVRLRTEVAELHGTHDLEAVTLATAGVVAAQPLPCKGLFCFIGARPATSWLPETARDAAGFLLTDRQLTADADGGAWTGAERAPLPYETSLPGVFAVGDVRADSMKRVAAAVGEGASAVRSVHQYLALTPARA